jgi:membrane AbrB-like protein
VTDGADPPGPDRRGPGAWGRAGRWALLLALTVAGTVGLDALAVPSPALFAGLVAAMLLALVGRAPGRVSRRLSTSAQAVVGVVIGVLARPETLVAVARDWLPVLLVGSATLLLSMAAGLLLGRRPGVSPLTGMLALTAGGASGLVAVSRDLGGDDRVVAVIQYLRVVLVTVSMPLVAATVYGASGGTGSGTDADGGPWWAGLLLTALCGGVGVPLARLLRVPAGGLLGPMTVALILTLTGVADVAPPDLLVELAYAVIGWQAGVRFTRESLRLVAGLLPAAVGLIAAVVAVSAALGALLARLTGATPLEGYLATTPGGIYAVLATAISSGVDVAFVVAVQVLRVIVMLLVAPVAARWVASRR